MMVGNLYIKLYLVFCCFCCIDKNVEELCWKSTMNFVGTIMGLINGIGPEKSAR